MVHIGFSGHLTPGDIFEDLDFAIENGLDAYELSLHYKEEFDMSHETLGQIKRLSEEGGIHLSVHVPYYLSTATQLDEVHQGNLEVLRRAFQIASRVDAKKIVIHGGYKENPENELNLAYLVKNCKDIVDLANAYDVTVCLENFHNGGGLMCLEPEDLLYVLKAVPGLHATLDTGHANTSSQDPAHFYELMKQYVAHAHVHDNDGDHDAHKPLGEGNIDFEQLLGRMRDAGYEGSLICELRTYEAILEAKRIVQQHLEKQVVYNPSSK